MLHEILRMTHAVLPGEGEDSFALRSDEHGAFLCVADGCGGMGSKRYASLDDRTGAFLASRLAVRTFAEWCGTHWNISENTKVPQEVCSELEQKLFLSLKTYAEEHSAKEASRISGTMQRCLPTTFCALTVQESRLTFWWAGDSRGYVMDEDGLHQYTRDHLRGDPDAFDSLYRDAPLSNLLSADQPGKIQLRSAAIGKPYAAIVATDGVYSCLPTPMEMEMLLLDTLKRAASLADWERKMQFQIAKNAQDDATLLMLINGFESFDHMKNLFLTRREALQKQFITPIRRRRGELHYAREKWLQYKPGYDRTEDEHA